MLGGLAHGYGPYYGIECGKVRREARGSESEAPRVPATWRCSIQGICPSVVGRGSSASWLCREGRDLGSFAERCRESIGLPSRHLVGIHQQGGGLHPLVHFGDIEGTSIVVGIFFFCDLLESTANSGGIWCPPRRDGLPKTHLLRRSREVGERMVAVRALYMHLSYFSC